MSYSTCGRKWFWCIVTILVISGFVLREVNQAEYRATVARYRKARAEADHWYRVEYKMAIILGAPRNATLEAELFPCERGFGPDCLGPGF
jgi:hypothetical protein